MNGKTLLELSSPVTQSCEAVKQLIAYHHHGQVPKEMPDFYWLSGEMVLVLSNKKDAYYVVTSKACSCSAATYHPGQPCKHQRKFFPPAKRPQSNAMLASQHGPKKLSLPPEEGYTGHHGAGFKPILPVSEVA